MQTKKSLLELFLEKALKDTKAGHCDISDEDAIRIISVIRNSINGEMMSKYQAYTYIGVSRPTFDTLVSRGLIPKGMKQQGFKELFWIKKDLDNYLQKCK